MMMNGFAKRIRAVAGAPSRAAGSNTHNVRPILSVAFWPVVSLLFILSLFSFFSLSRSLADVVVVLPDFLAAAAAAVAKRGELEHR